MSADLSFIEVTPLALLPKGLKSSIGNLIAIPQEVPIMISSFDFASLTQFNLSPSSREIAIIPLLRMFAKLSSSILLMKPFCVSIIKFKSCEKLLTGTTAVMVSPCSIGSTFTIGSPFD